VTSQGGSCIVSDGLTYLYGLLGHYVWWLYRFDGNYENSYAYCL